MCATVLLIDCHCGNGCICIKYFHRMLMYNGAVNVKLGC